jgi:hypothetical protein
MNQIRKSAFILLVLLLPAASAWAAVGPGTTLETFDGTIGSWDRVDWVPGSLTMESMTNSPPLPDSIRFLDDPTGSQLHVNEVYHRGSVHLDGRPHDRGTSRRCHDVPRRFQQQPGELGRGGGSLLRPEQLRLTEPDPRQRREMDSYRKIAGSLSSDFNNLGQLDNQWIMQGVDLTADEMQFYASPGGIDQLGSADFDGQMTQDLSAMNFSRPATWTGTAAVGNGTNMMMFDQTESDSRIYRIAAKQ